ncbi:MAG: potassium channel family protein [Cyanobacteriota bacterium]|nr:potassium channel family protein [Cyanobacteriota bacterium]
MSWKLMRWSLLVAAVAAAVLLSSDQTPPLQASCPSLGTLVGIVLGMLIATTAIHALVTFTQTELIHAGRISTWCSTSSGRRFFLVAIGALWTAATLLLDIVLWAWVYRHVGAIHDFETSLYFSGVTFTTVGYGDVTLAKCWQLLSVGEAVNGVLMAGWSTAQLIFLVQRMMRISLHIDEPKGH